MFQVAFGSDAAAAKFLRVSRMAVWRWRHDKAPLPPWLVKILPDLLQSQVAEAHLAQTEFGISTPSRQGHPDRSRAVRRAPSQSVQGSCSQREKRSRRLTVSQPAGYSFT